MQHKVFAICAFQRIDKLLIIARAQSGHDQSLGFTAREQAGAMGARQHTDFRHNRAHIGKAATVNTFFRIKNTATHNVTFQTLKGTGNGIFLVRAGIIGNKLGGHHIAQFSDFALTGLLVSFLISRFQTVLRHIGNF